MLRRHHVAGAVDPDRRPIIRDGEIECRIAQRLIDEHERALGAHRRGGDHRRDEIAVAAERVGAGGGRAEEGAGLTRIDADRQPEMRAQRTPPRVAGFVDRDGRSRVERDRRGQRGRRARNRDGRDGAQFPAIVAERGEGDSAIRERCGGARTARLRGQLRYPV